MSQSDIMEPNEIASMMERSELSERDVARWRRHDAARRDIATRWHLLADQREEIIEKFLPQGRLPGDCDAWAAALDQIRKLSAEVERLRAELLKRQAKTGAGE